jgi:hypothetical protein
MMTGKVHDGPIQVDPQRLMTTRIAWIIVLLHALVSTAHGFAHYGLGITLSAFQSAYVLVVISLAPLLAAGLLWARRARPGFVILVLSMAASLVFGFYWHYVAVSPDNVFHLHDGNLQTLFRSTALLLMVSEASGVAVGLWGLLGKQRARLG